MYVCKHCVCALFIRVFLVNAYGQTQRPLFVFFVFSCCIFMFFFLNIYGQAQDLPPLFLCIFFGFICVYVFVCVYAQAHTAHTTYTFTRFCIQAIHVYTMGDYTLRVGAGGLHGRGGGVYAGGYSGYTSLISGENIDIKAGGGGGGAGHNQYPESGILVTYTNPINGSIENSSGGGGGTVRENQAIGTNSGNGVSGDGGIGNSDSNQNGGGGGGGGSEGDGESATADNSNAAGNGGLGINVNIIGSSVNYGAGGGGGGRYSNGDAGGESGGRGTSWNGVNWNNNVGFPGKDGQGGGGGGSGDTAAGGKGGSGIIIIKCQASV